MVWEVEALMLDQGGVMSEAGVPGTNEKAAAQIMGLPSPIEVPQLADDLKRGRISNEEFVAEVNQRYPNAPRLLTDEVWKFIRSWLKPDDRTYELARKCRAAGLRVGVLSNINPGMVRIFRADGSYTLDGEWFNPLVLSCEVGYAKPDPEIYVVAEEQLARFGIEPRKILLLDDQQKCVDGALERGWQADLVTDLDEMVRNVTARLGLK